MPVPASVDANGALRAIEESDVDARLVMLIVAAIVTSALDESGSTDESERDLQKQ